MDVMKARVEELERFKHNTQSTISGEIKSLELKIQLLKNISQKLRDTIYDTNLSQVTKKMIITDYRKKLGITSNWEEEIWESDEPFKVE